MKTAFALGISQSSTKRLHAQYKHPKKHIKLTLLAYNNDHVKQGIRPWGCCYFLVRARGEQKENMTEEPAELHLQSINFLS